MFQVLVLFTLLNGCHNYELTKFCESNEIYLGGSDLTFSQTRAGTTAIPNEFCVDSDYNPLTRLCLKNGTWDTIQGGCSSTNQTDLTKFLRSYNERSLKELAACAKNVSTVVDIHLFTKILNSDCRLVEGRENEATYIFEAVEDVMFVNRTVLEESQLKLNSTDIILDGYENCLMKSVKDENDFKINLTGLVVDSVGFAEDLIGFVAYKNRSISKILKNSENFMTNPSDIDLAVVFKSSLSSSRIYFSIFYKDFLFNSKRDFLVNSRIFYISSQQSLDLQIYFKQSQQIYSSNENCGYWKYGLDDKNVPFRGFWSIHSEYVDLGEGVFLCKFNQTKSAYFSLLAFEGDNSELIYTVTFCLVLLIFAILSVSIVIFTFKRWRESSNRKTILNLSYCQLALIVFLIFSNLNMFCSNFLYGVVLSYLILTNFFWILVICLANYVRFVNELTDREENLTLKFTIFCWGLPGLMVIPNLVKTLQVHYRLEDFCTPRENLLKLTVLIPVFFVLSIVLTVIAAVLKNLVYRSYDLKKKTFSKSHSIPKSILVLFIFLLTFWTFVLACFFGSFFTSVWFYFVFCSLSVLLSLIFLICYILFTIFPTNMWYEKISYIYSLKKSLEEKTDSKEKSDVKLLTRNEAELKSFKSRI